MSKASKYRDLRAIRNLLTQAQQILTTERTGGGAYKCLQLLDTALELTDSLIARSAGIEKQDTRSNESSLIGHHADDFSNR
jgi:hypothetical protein